MLQAAAAMSARCLCQSSSRRATASAYSTFSFMANRFLPKHERLENIKGDLRDAKLLPKTIPSSDAVTHLACISNDPSFELNPALGKSINFDAFFDLIAVAKDNGVKRFVYASSSSVYGVKPEDNVTEEPSLQPLTDYSKYKALCDEGWTKSQ